MGEIGFVVQKIAMDNERKLKDWRQNQLRDTIIPHLAHELKTVKELGLEYVSVYSKLEHAKKEYKALTGTDYSPSC